MGNLIYFLFQKELICFNKSHDLWNLSETFWNLFDFEGIYGEKSTPVKCFPNKQSQAWPRENRRIDRWGRSGLTISSNACGK